MGLFSRSRKARSAGDDAERRRAEDAYADVILLIDELPVADRGDFLTRAERFNEEIRRAAGSAGAHNRLVQIESELRALARRVQRALD